MGVVPQDKDNALPKRVSTPGTNWNSSRIEWANCHTFTFQWQFVCSVRDECKFVPGVDGLYWGNVLWKWQGKKPLIQLATLPRSARIENEPHSIRKVRNFRSIPFPEAGHIGRVGGGASATTMTTTTKTTTKTPTRKRHFQLRGLKK